MKYLLLTLSIAASTCTIAQVQKKPAAKTVEKPKQAAAEPTGIDPGIAPMPAPPPPAIYQFVEQMPEPSVDMGNYLAEKLRYPDSARINGIQGRVVVKFIVNEDGTLSDIKAVRGLGFGLDEEAVRVLKSMPPWRPGRQNGKAVKVYYTQPLSFMLH